MNLLQYLGKDEWVDVLEKIKKNIAEKYQKLLIKIIYIFILVIKV